MYWLTTPPPLYWANRIFYCFTAVKRLELETVKTMQQYFNQDLVNNRLIHNSIGLFLPLKIELFLRLPLNELLKNTKNFGEI